MTRVFRVMLGDGSNYRERLVRMPAELIRSSRHPRLAVLVFAEVDLWRGAPSVHELTPSSVVTRG